jgi:3-deoxy-D-manno-octulosonate 8-phosphate phosphatase (KDO 8-P phosphatase)
MGNLIPKLKEIKGFIFDIDGVMTPGQVLVTEEGHQLRSVNIKDGYAVQHAVKQGYTVAVISGGKSEGMRKRFEGLGVKWIFMAQSHKEDAFYQVCSQSGLKPHEFAYMGDDMPDMPVLGLAGLSCCPKDACSDVLDVCEYISDLEGGKGCVRELIEKVMKIQQTWYNDDSHRW